jgi:Restriction endonuclease S subunits
VTAPKLRFHGFLQDWTCSELSHIAEINPKSGSLPQKFYYIDLESVVSGELINALLISSTNAPSRAQRVLVTGDVLFQTVRPYQKNNYHYTEKKEYHSVASTGYAQLRTKLNESFLYQLLYTERFGYEVNIRCTGSSYPAINSSDLGEITVNYPCREEQQKIAELFRLLDLRIKLQRRKVELLKDYKKRLLNDIFSQSILCKNCINDWRLTSLGTILKIKHGKDQKKIESHLGKYPILGSGGIIGYTDTPLCNWACVLIGRKGTINKPYYMDTPFWTIDTLFYSEPIQENNPLFQYYLFQTVRWEKYSEASGVPSLNSHTIESIRVHIPTIPEQIIISKLFSSIDKNISAQENKLKQIKIFKAGLLQKMFI